MGVRHTFVNYLQRGSRWVLNTHFLTNSEPAINVFYWPVRPQLRLYDKAGFKSYPLVKINPKSVFFSAVMVNLANRCKSATCSKELQTVEFDILRKNSTVLTPAV